VALWHERQGAAMGAGQETSVGARCASLADPRADRGQDHLLLDMIAIALCAVICGADGWVAVETFGRAKAAWLRTFLALPGGIPSHDTFGRVFARLEPAEFRRCFLSWVGAMVPDTVGQVVALDGKTLRRSHDRANGKAALHLVSAWASGSGLVLGQLAVDDKSNEIVAIPALLALLDVRGSTVTIDAMGCQTAIARQIVAQGADYALALKDNHPTLHAEVAEEFAAARANGFADVAPADHDHWATVEQGHGRVETRRYWVIREPATITALDQGGAWAGLRAIGLVERERRIGTEVSVEARHYLLSGAGGAAAFGQAVRSHWGIENRAHWVLDVAFREGESRVRVGDGAENLAVLRHVALNLLRQDTTRKGSLASKRFRAALDHHYLLTILAGLHC
jgi:predicted transposase YbfD/YdcC